jgi:hypothetical protein
MQFLGLNSTNWRQKLGQELRRVGYELGNLDEVLDDEISVSPLGQGPSFVLQVKHYEYVSWHAYLYNAADMTDSSEEAPEPIADWRLSTDEKHPKSCYDVWIDWIVEGVRDASRST